MRAAVLKSLGAPVCDEFREPQAGDGEIVLDVAAAGINHLDLLKASGRFYAGPPPLPSVVGSDGVGRTSDGRLVYSDDPVAPFGTLAERAVVREETTMPVPEGVDPAVAAALGNAGIAAWTALEWRGGLRRGETVIVLGGSGVVGRLGVQIARLLGAGRIIAADRDQAGLDRAAELGADRLVRLDAADDLAGALSGGDVVLDLLWGAPASVALELANDGVRLIQVGHLAGATTEISAPIVRGRLAEIRGHAGFKTPLDVRRAAYTRLAEGVRDGHIEVDVEHVPLEQISEAWSRQASGTGGTKLVVVP